MEERVIWRGKISLWSQAGSFGQAAVWLAGAGAAWAGVGNLPLVARYGVSCLGLCAAAGILFRVASKYFGVSVTLTNEKLRVRQGILNKQQIEMRLERIESVKLSESLAGRLFGYGDLEASGFGSTHARIEDLAFAKDLSDLLSKKAKS